MKPEHEFPVPPTIPESEVLPSTPPKPPPLEPAEGHFLKWTFFGGQGLRAGWSVALFLALTFLLLITFSAAAKKLISGILHIKTGNSTAATSIIGEVIFALAILGEMAVCALIERRRILDYNLRGARRSLRFLSGIAGGFAALSLLVGGLFWGGWLHFGSSTLSGIQIVQYGSLWGIAFLLTGLVEEGSVRCYLQFTLTRGINLWWAFGLIAAMCLSGLLFIHNEGIWGVYAMAGLGVLPCLWLHVTRSTSAGFWQATWVTSTFFGFIHTGNNGETWIGIFSAAAIGFVFCVSIRLTGSAWWAIGFHAAWDWGQTFFYGTADSGFAAKGHYLATVPAGATLWSGGTDGPEGSLLVLPLILVVLIALIAFYGRKTSQPATLSAPERVAG
jgi:hypothetical protein